MSTTAEDLTSLRTMLATVRAVDDVHPHLRQITFGGGDLAPFAPAGPDTFLYVLLPPVGRTELTIDQGFTWTGYRDMPEDERPVGAYYTLRRWRPEDAELDLLFVLHGEAGPASEWAGRAAPGDPVALWGPRTAWHPPAGTERYLLVADDTGLPAVAVILETVPDGVPVTVVAEVDAPDEQLDLRVAPSTDVRWLHRSGAEPGTTTRVVEAVRAIDLDPAGLYAWGGGESHMMTAVRTHLRRQVGLEREQVSMVAYWRHADHLPDDEDD